MKQLLVFLLAFALSGQVFGQAETLIYGSHLAQATSSNPAYQNEYNLVLIGTSLYQNTFFTGPTVGDALKTNNGQTFFDAQSFLNALDEDNLFRQQIELHTLGGAVNLGALRLSLNHNFRFEAQAVYSKELAELALLGNGQFVGDTVRLDHDLQLFSYSELAVGGAMRLGKLQVGANLKWLNGIGSLATEKGQLSLYTDPGVYDITFISDYRVNASSLASLSLNDSIQFNFNPSSLDFNTLITKNQGIALDLGVIVDLGAVELSASATNLGSIKWTENVRNYASSTNVTYSGLDLTDLLTSDSLDFPSTVDTLKSLINLSETQDAYSTTLPAEYRLGLRFEAGEKLYLGAVLGLQTFGEQSYKTLGFYATFAPIRILNLQASYTVVNDTYTNLGLGGALKLGPAKVYAMTDNFPALFSPKSARHFQGRIGVNLVFGKKDLEK